jgi:hypothetical protein
MARPAAGRPEAQSGIWKHKHAEFRLSLERGAEFNRSKGEREKLKRETYKQTNKEK